MHVQKMLHVSVQSRLQFTIEFSNEPARVRQTATERDIGNFSRHFVTVLWNRRATSSSATVTRARNRFSTRLNAKCLYTLGLDDVTNFLEVRENPADDRYPTGFPNRPKFPKESGFRKFWDCWEFWNYKE